MLEILEASMPHHFNSNATYADSRWRESSPPRHLSKSKHKSPLSRRSDWPSQLARKTVALEATRRAKVLSETHPSYPRDRSRSPEVTNTTSQSNIDRRDTGSGSKAAEPACNLPTATYKWDSFLVKPKPTMYVNYGEPIEIAPARSLSFTTRRSPSIVSDSASSSVSASRLPPVSGKLTVSRRSTLQSQEDLNLDFHRLDIQTDESSPSPREHGSFTASGSLVRMKSESRGSSVTTSPTTSTAPLPAGDSGWMLHARPVSSSQYMCLWKDEDHEHPRPCGYTSKKHLVKRHLESKHLNIRRLICPVCGKGFSQKSNFSTHMNTHTGDAPHQCRYCDRTFGDPARRHRHMKAEHGHISARRKKQGECEFVPAVWGQKEEEYYSPEEEESE